MKLMGHSTVTVSQRRAHPSPDAMSRRMEAWNTARLRGVGTDSGQWPRPIPLKNLQAF
jgi:hypothetical protein